jgi:hypothetical protein
MATLAAHPNTLHASLIDALGGPDPERGLEQAFIQLGRGAELPLLLAMIKALVRAGLAGIACRLLRSSGGLLAAEPQLAALAAQLETMPSGEIPQDIIRRRIQTNVQAMIASRQALAPALKSVNAAVANSMRIFASAKGNVYVLRDHASGKIEFVLPFADQIAHAAAAKVDEPAVGASFLMRGVPSPSLWQRVMSLRAATGYTPPLVLIENDLEVFSIWLGLFANPEMLVRDHMFYFTGPGAIEEYRTWLSGQPSLQPPTMTITSVRPRWQPPAVDAKLHEAVTLAHSNRNARLKGELDQWYTGKNPDYWRQRFSTACRSGPALRIVGLTSRFSTVMQHAMRDLASAFHRRGCAFEVIKQPADHIGSVDVVGEIHRVRPDLVVVINHLRTELRNAIPSCLPYVCWIQDYMQYLWNSDAGASVGEFDLILGHSPAVMSSVYGYPSDRFLATNNLTSTDVFSPELVNAEDLATYKCDIAYVGHGWESPEQLVADISRENHRFGRYMAEIVSFARRRLDEAGYLTTQDLVSIILSAETSSGHSELTPAVRRSLVVPTAQRLIDRILRHQTLEWAAEWARRRNRKLSIFGSGWNRHHSFQQFAAGAVEHGYPLRCVYQAATINLQVNAYGSLHQRLLDGVASGGFVMARYNPADFIREPHLVIKTYIDLHGINDLESLLRLSASHEALQNAIACAEQLTGTRIATIDDPVRARHVFEHVQCASLSEAEFSDAGLMNVLKHLISIPHRAAADIDGFAQATFRSKTQMHTMLDHFIFNSEHRSELSRRMRQSVLQHDTYDVLVNAILRFWTGQEPGEG